MTIESIKKRAIRMKITTVIPTYNRSESLIRALKSVLAQTLPCDEILVVDDASTDHSLEALKVFIQSTDARQIKVISLPKNLGVSGARNKGVELASHPWIALLDSDDEWTPDKLEKQMNSLKISGRLVSHTHESWVRNGKPVKQKTKHKKYGGFVYDQCVEICFMGPSTSIIHKSVFDDVGLFDESFVVCEDYDLWLRITPTYKVDYVDEALLVKHGGHDDQLSMAFKGMDYWRVRALKKQLTNKNLSTESLRITKNKFDEKIRILKSGCEKHGNIELLKKINALTS